MSDLVRYRVKQTCFVNGSLAHAVGGKDVFVMAAPGLEGEALELSPVTEPKQAKGEAKKSQE